jgi:hypothetical protein
LLFQIAASFRDHKLFDIFQLSCTLLKQGVGKQLENEAQVLEMLSATIQRKTFWCPLMFVAFSDGALTIIEL